MLSSLNRRSFMTGLTGIATGLSAQPALTESPLEVTRVRLPLYRNISDCQVPEYISTDLLKAEGFTDIQFVEKGTGPDSSDWLGDGEIDFDWNYPPAIVRLLAQGRAIKALAGMHGGCLELFAGNGIGSVKDLKGKRIGVDTINGIPHLLLIVLVANVGLDPYNDIVWFTKPGFDPMKSLAAGEIDACFVGPPVPQQMRASGIGHAILKTTTDRPWSQYFCCMVAGTAEFVEHNPVATKRVLRAFMKSIDLCATDPERVARMGVDRGFAADFETALQAYREVRYDVWRDYDPADSIRFYALRMLESGIITANPNDIIAQGSEWRFINELKRELKT